MQPFRFVAVLSASLAILGILSSDTVSPTRLEASPRSDASEVARIQMHFDSILKELAARDVSSLSSSQLRRRWALIETLRKYRDRAQFPHNYDFPGQQVPYFLDRKTGALCAVGHLLLSTGRRDIVTRVSSTNNNVRIAELSGDSALLGWLNANGLTLDEAAFIQPAYHNGGSVGLGDPHKAGYQLATVAAIGAAGALSLWNTLGNANGHSEVGTGLGLVTGVGALALAVGARGSKSSLTSYMAANAIAGGLSLGLAINAIARHNRELSMQHAAYGRGPLVASIAPTISASKGRSAGVVLSVRY